MSVDISYWDQLGCLSLHALIGRGIAMAPGGLGCLLHEPNGHDCVIAGFKGKLSNMFPPDSMTTKFSQCIGKSSTLK